MYEMKIRHYFDSAHQLPDSPDLVTKKCCNLHGHTYAVDVFIEKIRLKSGMIVDFKAVKDMIDILDHQNINEVFLKEGISHYTTAEMIAKFLFRKIQDKLQEKNETIRYPIVKKVSICEGYKGENNSSWVSYDGVDN